jgi:hypothetical protein
MLPLKICFAERVAQVAMDLAKIGKLESDLVE